MCPILLEKSIQRTRFALVACFRLTKKWFELKGPILSLTPPGNTFSRKPAQWSRFEVLQKPSTLPRVVWARKSKTGFGFKIGLYRKGYDNVLICNWWAIQLCVFLHDKMMNQFVFVLYVTVMAQWYSTKSHNWPVFLSQCNFQVHNDWFLVFVHIGICTQQESLIRQSLMFYIK